MSIVVLVILFLLVFLGPFIVPVPALAGLMPVEDLADPNSQFIKINDLNLHVKSFGQGTPVFVLLHGFGASLYSWDAIVQPLGEQGLVIAFDRPAFGLTERPMRWKGINPYSPQSQIKLLIGLLDHYGVQKAILIGNSAGGTLAMQAALEFPERVSALILVDPAVYNGGGAPAWIRPFFKSPQMQHLGPLVARQFETRGADLINTAWHDPSKISQETRDSYQKPLKVENWDKALWFFTVASEMPELEKNFSKLTLPVLVITGDDDRIVPTRESVRLADELPHAQLVVIPNAGHVPHEEKPAEFMNAVQNFLSTS